MRSPFLGLTLAAIAGIVLADYFPGLFLLAAFTGAAFALLNLYRPVLITVWVTVLTTFYCLHVTQTVWTDDQLRLAELPGTKAVNVAGEVVSEPKLDAGGTATFLFCVDSLRLEDGSTTPLKASVLARWRGRTEMGARLALFGTLQPIAGPRNPGEFDAQTYFARKGVTHTLVVRYPENGHQIERGRISLRGLAARSRAWMQKTLSLGIEDSPEVVGLICGTSLGLRHQTPEDIEEPFQQTGTLHLFAVAGLHVGIVAALLWLLADVFRLPRKIATALIIPSLFFYAAITGLHTASLRAAVMSAILLGGIFFDRKVFALNSLAAAAFIILLLDSNELFSSGFQLSFAVVGSIIVISDPLFLRLRRMVQPDPFLPRILFGKIRRAWVATTDHVARALSVSIAAWVGSLALVYWYFHLVSPISLLANLVVVPLAYFILALALLSVISAPLSLSVFFNNANWLLSHAVLIVVHCFAAFPGSHEYLGRLDEKITPITVTVLDEGTGGATCLRAGSYSWLIDCGNNRSYRQTLKAFLHSRGINRLEGLILTHGDAQHIGAAGAVLEEFRPPELFANPLAVRSSALRHFRESLPAAGTTSVRPLVRGDQLVLGKNVRANVLFPSSNLKVKSADDAPIIIRIVCNENLAILFESDAGASAEEALLAAGDDLRSDVLVKGQHHRGGSGSAAFLDAVHPALVVASARPLPVNEQIDERFIHDLTDRGISLFRQDETGAVTIELEQDAWQARAFVTNQVFRSSARVNRVVDNRKNQAAASVFLSSESGFTSDNR